MRRPPDKEGHSGMTDRDVDSSNATLNTLFGGARQKSWMNLGSRPSVRPTPRPSISKAAGHNATSVQTNSAAVMPSPTPSDEPSPILPHNAMADGIQNQNQNQRQTYSNNNRSPGRLDQRPAGIATRPSETVTRPSITLTQPRIPQSLPQVRANHPSPISVNTVPSVPSPTSAAAPSTQSLADGPGIIRSLQELESPTLLDSTTDLGQNFVSSGQPELRDTGEPANDSIQQRAEAPQAPREQLLSPSPISSPPTMAFDQPPLPASVLLPRQNQANPTSSSIQSNTHKRQRIQVPALSLKGRVALINAHMESVGGIHYLNNDLERPRFQLLSEACNDEDTFYVALHQLFCIWDSPRRGLLTSIPEFPSTAVLQISFKILGNLIRENKGLALSHLKWFINFPSPLADLMRTSEAYQKTVRNVGQFLARLASDWGPFSKVCVTRGYPPLVDELIQRMGLTSPILQHIMFTATRRNLGIEDDKYGEQMEKVFSEDKQGHQELASRFNTGRPPTEKEIVERNKKLIDKYLSINGHRIRVRQVSGPVMGSPLANSPMAPLQANIQRTASSSSSNNDASMASRQPNVFPNGNQTFSSPDGWHQNPYMQVQQNRLISNPSPNPQVQAVAGHPLNGSDNRSYSNAPSPTMLQGLSMNSPVVQSPVVQQQGSQWSTPVLRSSTFQVQNPAPGHTNGPAVPQQHLQQQVMMQQHQQLAAQQQQQLAMQSWQWQQQGHPQMQQQLHPQVHQQVQAQMAQQPMYQHAPQIQQAQQRPPQNQQPPYPLTLQHIPQQQGHQRQQQQQMEQQRQHMTTAAQQVLSTNRAAQLRSSGDPVDVQQRVHSRNNSMSSMSRTPAHSNSPNLAPHRPIPSLILNPTVQDQVIKAYDKTPSLHRSLIPPLGYQQSQQPYNPDQTALHQAHVRSPRLVPEDVSAKVPGDDSSNRYYQSVKNLAIAAAKIPIASSMSYLEFSISDEDFALVPKDKVIGTEPLPVREFKLGSLQYRLRCISLKRDTTKCVMSEWIGSDTIWPETVFIEINGHQLEIRRKTHHGKDLPIDITRYVVPQTSNGNLNRIKISVPRLRKAMRENHYFVAVEVIEVLQHPQIMEMCTKNQRIAASKTLESIKKALVPPSTDDDDDFAMVVSDLSIDLADPWMACIFEIPVRGNSCLHRECFDLQTFLLTRNSKAKRPNQPSLVDHWKCPLCGKDARPYSLQVDDFLAGVRAELAAQDNLDTKAILVSADGSWRAKPEPRSMKRKATDDVDDDPDSSDGEGTARKQQLIGRKNNPHLNGRTVSVARDVEVIELDDD